MNWNETIQQLYPTKGDGYMWKPMLSATVESIYNLKYPLLASPKIDGIRCIMVGGVASTRSLKPIPNIYIRDILAFPAYNGLDGELVVGKPTAKEVFQATDSGVMSRDGKPIFTYNVFDCILPEIVNLPFYERLVYVQAMTQKAVHARFVSHTTVHNVEELEDFEATMLKLGYEGVMLRDPNGPYKSGRSTLKQGWLMKMKRFVDDEAIIVGFTERMHNANEPTISALGYQERSSHKANQVPTASLGAFIVQAKEKWSTTFKVGSGFDEAQRFEFWIEREKLLGTTIKFKYQPIGVKDLPRQPIFLGFRHD